MSAEIVKVLLVDENADNLGALRRQLAFPDIEVVGEAGFGTVAFTWAQHFQPDIALVSVEEPLVRSLKTIELLALGHQPRPVIAVSSLGERDMLRKAMVAGASDYLVRPVPPDELRRALLTLHNREQSRRRGPSEAGAQPQHEGMILTVFGAKGGIGKSTLATNLAVSLAAETRRRVALLDLDLEFGDVALLLDLVPSKTIADLVPLVPTLDPDLLQSMLSPHPSGVQVLPAPLHPEEAEAVSPDHVARILQMLALTHDYVVVDTAAVLSDATLRVLDMATIILLVTSQEIASVKRAKTCLGLMRHWQYSDEKVKLVINRANGQGAKLDDIATAFEHPIFWKVPHDEAMAKATTTGTPVVLGKPGAPGALAVRNLARTLAGQQAGRRGLTRFMPRLRTA